MKKTLKGMLCAFLVLLTLLIIYFVFIILYWNGAFNKFFVSDVSSYTSPDESYSLCFQQLGDPEFPFGATEVRLVLENENGKKLSLWTQRYSMTVLTPVNIILSL